MNCIIPFTKDIKFKTNIAEILSISLEHDFTANPEEVLGNFIISGDYKTHEVSVNIEYSINAEEVKEEVKEEDLFKRVEEPELDKILDEIEADREESVDVSERDIADDAKNTILDSINNTDDAYITYHLHEMKETDTIDSICIKYNTSKNIIEDYNDISNLSLGDKVIIPEVNE